MSTLSRDMMFPMFSTTRKGWVILVRGRASGNKDELFKLLLGKPVEAEVEENVEDGEERRGIVSW